MTQKEYEKTYHADEIFFVVGKVIPEKSARIIFLMQLEYRLVSRFELISYSNIFYMGKSHYTWNLGFKHPWGNCPSQHLLECYKLHLNSFVDQKNGFHIGFPFNCCNCGVSTPCDGWPAHAETEATSCARINICWHFRKMAQWLMQHCGAARPKIHPHGRVIDQAVMVENRFLVGG